MQPGLVCRTGQPHTYPEKLLKKAAASLQLDKKSNCNT